MCPLDEVYGWKWMLADAESVDVSGAAMSTAGGGRMKDDCTATGSDAKRDTVLCLLLIFCMFLCSSEDVTARLPGDLNRCSSKMSVRRH